MRAKLRPCPFSSPEEDIHMKIMRTAIIISQMPNKLSL
jgi:hypothetical protein